MALPSQMGRPQPTRRVTTYRRAKKPGPPLIVVLLLVVVGLVVVGAVAVRVLPGAGPEQAVADSASDDGSGDRSGEASDDTIPGGAPTGPITLRDDSPVTAIPDPDQGATGEPDPAMDAILSGNLPANNDDEPTGLLSGAVSGSEVPAAEREPEPISRPDPAPINTPAAAWETLLASGRLVEARAAMSARLHAQGVSAGEQARLRRELSDLNERLVFGTGVEPGDPMCEWYTVQSGDSLGRIASRRELLTEWKLIQRVNGLSDPRRIRVGQRLKLVRGPFHAIVHKGDFRLDLYHGPPEEPERWVFVRSFDVGLGEGDGTPAGSFVVAPNKLENPGWVNPRDSRERYDRDDPANPIGEFWIGLQGLGDDAIHRGYGIHGTIEPESIGQSMSMGCVRLRDDDVALIYELLAEGTSVVHILP